MPAWSRLALLPVAAYALGCFVAAYYLVRMRTGQDLRVLGSGNAGASNVGRVFGPAAFALVLVVDAGKGVLATWGSRTLGGSEAVVAASMLAVTAGHVWPVQLGFRGGKGAATALGILSTINVTFAAVLLGTGLVVFAATRRYEAGGFTALVVAPVVAGVLGYGAPMIGGLAGLAAIVVLAHRLNQTSSNGIPAAPRHDARGRQALS